MSNAVEETALSRRTETSGELAQTGAAAEKQYEIQSAIIVARNFPRNEDAAFQKLMKACQRTSFAEDAAYSFPRGGQSVEGPSINLAREAARVWGNIRHGVEVIRDDETSRQIRAFAWDMETNTKVTAEDDFRKLIQRKSKSTGKTEWVAPDERDLRELTNRRGAIIKRNCILEVLPKDLVEDAMSMAKQTLKAGAERDPEGARKKIILAFSELNITPEMIERNLGHPLSQCSPKEIADLRTIYKSISDGNSTWAEYVAEKNGHDLGEVGRKSDAPKSPVDKAADVFVAEATAATERLEPKTSPLPFDVTKPHHVDEVTAAAKKGGPFTVTLKGGTKLSCSDARLYIAATSAKQSGASVIVEAKLDGETLTLTGLEEME